MDGPFCDRFGCVSGAVWLYLAFLLNFQGLSSSVPDLDPQHIVMRGLCRAESVRESAIIINASVSNRSSALIPLTRIP